MESQGRISLSIIIPVFCVSAYVERCLKSVMNQSYDLFECILVDDASPDDSIAKCEQMISEYEGPISFRIIHHKQNRGLSAARNTGTDAATGDYILFVDSDDILSNDCVEKLMAPVLKDDSVEMVFGGWMILSEAGGFAVSKKFKWEKKEFVTNEEVRNFYYNPSRIFVPAAWNKLIKRNFLYQNNLRFREGQLWEDVLWSFFVVKHLSHLVSIADVTYFYYYRVTSISKGTVINESIRHHLKIYEIISLNFTPGEEGREAVHYIREFLSYYLQLPYNQISRATARRFSQALPFRQYPREKALLVAARILPHNPAGKKLLASLEKKLASWRKNAAGSA